MQLRTALPTALSLGALLGVGIVCLSFASAGAREQQAVVVAAVHTIVEAPIRWDLPMQRNGSVERFVLLFRDKQPDRMALYLKRSGRYEGMIRQKLRARGMPEDLVYLSMIESGFLPSARSRAGAVGLWQLMGEVAQDYGLRVDGYVDERRDPEKSTDAALRYLDDLHRHFGSWILAAAAYNSGENRVARIMREETGSEQGVDSDFWRIRSRLPADTREYVPLIQAAALVAKEPHRYGLGDVERWLPTATDTVQVAGGVKLETVAKAVGVSGVSLEKLNPHLIRGMTPPGGTYAVRIPDGRGPLYARRLADRSAAEKVSRAPARRDAPARDSHAMEVGD
jgi:membrane-bound lytic murein transglycosylase D